MNDCQALVASQQEEINRLNKLLDQKSRAIRIKDKMQTERKEEIQRLNGWLDACNDREMALKEELEAAHNLARTRLEEFSNEAKQVVELERRLKIRQGIIEIRGREMVRQNNELVDLRRDNKELREEVAYYKERAAHNMSDYVDMKEFADNLEERHEDVCRIHDELLKEHGALQDKYNEQKEVILDLESDKDFLESMKEDSDEIIENQVKEIQDLAIEVGQARYDARDQVAEKIQDMQERFDELQADYDDMIGQHWRFRAAIQGALSDDEV